MDVAAFASVRSILDAELLLIDIPLSYAAPLLYKLRSTSSKTTTRPRQATDSGSDRRSPVLISLMNVVEEPEESELEGLLWKTKEEGVREGKFHSRILGRRPQGFHFTIESNTPRRAQRRLGSLIQYILDVIYIL